MSDKCLGKCNLVKLMPLKDNLLIKMTFSGKFCTQKPRFFFNIRKSADVYIKTNSAVTQNLLFLTKVSLFAFTKST